MTHKYFYLAVLFLSAAIASCSKDPVSSVATNQPLTHRLLFSPDTLRGAPYQYLAMKARVDGLASSDIYLNWQFDGMSIPTPLTHLEPEKPITNIAYLAKGTYKIKAQAFDAFNDTLIRQDSTLALIDSVSRQVVLLPRSCDTGIFQNPDGTIGEAIDLIANAASSASTDFFTYDFHITGTHLDTLIHSTSNDMQFVFPAFGTYHASVRVKDVTGNFYGSDSAVYKIRMPTVDFALLRSSKSVGFILITDNGSNAYNNLPDNGEASGALLNMNDSINTISWTKNAFAIASSFTSDSTLIQSNDSLSGTFSSDFHTLKLFSASNHDTQSFYYSNWGLTIKNAKLLRVTASDVVYAIIGLPADEFVGNPYSGENGLSPDFFDQLFDT
ncbi:MAG TPA: hypothetical protein VEW28_01890, partial [Candidatus Kapabacteria bacterium]|nr:hypothetical protein [Candidatus Kapabacteria bacterium]